MILSRYKEEKNIFKMIARQEGISVAEVRREMEKTILEAYHNEDVEARAEFKKMFGDKLPTPEEFIYKTAKQIKRETR